MFYFEQKEKEILSTFKKFQSGLLSFEELKKFHDETKNKNIQYNLPVQNDDTNNFLRYERYWVLLVDVLQKRVDRGVINNIVNKIKAEDFIKRVRYKCKDTVVKMKNIDKPLLYFDNNTYIYLKKCIPLKKINSEYQFVYSPAHLEELANSIRQKDFKYDSNIEKDLKYLSDLTNNVEFLPNFQEGIIIGSECPNRPLERVIKDFDGTILSEQMEQDFLENRELIREELSLKIKGSNIIGILMSSKAEKLLEKEMWYIDYKNFSEKTLFWEKYKNNHNFLFTSLPYIVNVVELLDNNPEPSRKYRSHLHDTTHMIYATKSDIFVTNDSRLNNKVKEIFNFLGVETKVLNHEEFGKLCLL